MNRFRAMIGLVACAIVSHQRIDVVDWRGRIGIAGLVGLVGWVGWSFELVRLVGMVGLVGFARLIGLVGQPQRSNAKLSGRGYPGPIFQHPKSRATQSDTQIPGISSQQSQRSLSHGSRSRSHSRANLTKK